MRRCGACDRLLPGSVIYCPDCPGTRTHYVPSHATIMRQVEQINTHWSKATRTERMVTKGNPLTIPRIPPP